MLKALQSFHFPRGMSCQSLATHLTQRHHTVTTKTPKRLSNQTKQNTTKQNLPACFTATAWPIKVACDTFPIPPRPRTGPTTRLSGQVANGTGGGGGNPSPPAGHQSGWGGGIAGGGGVQKGGFGGGISGGGGLASEHESRKNIPAICWAFFTPPKKGLFQ